MALILDDIYRLIRASRYINPLNENDKLPLPYGDLTASEWQLPCIDTVNHVYAYAGFDVLSAGEGNSETIRVDGVAKTGGGVDYTFSNSNDYESEGLIATVTFTASQENKTVTASGSGRDDSGTLIENIIDVIVDFIDNVVSETSADELDATTKALVSSIFDSQSYKAAGVIIDDISYWSLFQSMLLSFYGRCYRNINDEIAFVINDGTLNQYAQVDRMNKGNIMPILAKRRKDDIVNRCPMQYAYNYVAKKYGKETNNDTHINTASQTKYGEQLPKSGSYKLPWVTDQTTAETIQGLLISDYAEPPWELKFKNDSYRLIPGDMFDIISLTVDFLYSDIGSKYTNQFFKIIGKSISMNKPEIIMRAIDTGAFLTTASLADGSADADGSETAGGKRNTNRY